MVQIALQTFDHYDARAHDKLAPSIAVWVRCLEKAVLESDWEMTLSFAQLVSLSFRCTEERAIRAFREVGSSLVIVLLRAWNLSSSSALAENVAKLLVRLSALPSSLRAILQGTLLVRTLQRIVRNNDDEYDGPVQGAAMRFLVGLSRHKDNAYALMQTPSLVTDVLAFESTENVEFLANLAWDGRIQADILVIRGLLDCLLSSWANCVDTRHFVMTTLHHLAMPAQNRIVLASKTTVLKIIVEELNGHRLQAEASDVLLRLTGHDTVQLVVKKSGVLRGLVRVAATSKVGNPAAINAAHTVKRIATYLRVSDKNHPELMQGLVSISKSSDPDVRAWCARALSEQAGSQATAFFLVRSPDALSMILNLANDSTISVQSAGTEALSKLASHSFNAKKLLTEDQVLMTLIAKANTTEGLCDEKIKICRLAVQGLLALLDYEPVRDRIAKELNFVWALSRFATSLDYDSELRREALQGVAILAPLL